MDATRRVPAPSAALDRYIGYFEPYATSHDALDRDEALQVEVRNAAASLVERVKQIRSGAFGTRGRGPRAAAQEVSGYDRAATHENARTATGTESERITSTSLHSDWRISGATR